MNTKTKTLFSLPAVVLASLAFTASASAYATVAPAPAAGSPGLPDGRLYEQVSPPDKNGNAAGNPLGGHPPVMLAEAGGDGVAYSDSSGSIGDTKNGGQFYTVAKRASAGWVNAGAQPLGISEQALLLMEPYELGFSADPDAGALPGAGGVPAGSDW